MLYTIPALAQAGRSDAECFTTYTSAHASPLSAETAISFRSYYRGSVRSIPAFFQAQSNQEVSPEAVSGCNEHKALIQAFGLS